MKIWKIASPLPFDTLAIEEGERKVDDLLTEGAILELDEKYGLKKHLGGGGFGIAFSTFDNKVVKITTDNSEYLSALELVGNKWFAPFVTIYEAYELYDGLYIIVKDIVTPLTEEEEGLFYMFTNEFRGDIDNVPEEFSDKKALFEEFQNYIEEMQNYTQFDDTFNVSNIGRNSGGQLVAFDPRQSSFA